MAKLSNVNSIHSKSLYILRYVLIHGLYGLRTLYRSATEYLDIFYGHTPPNDDIKLTRSVTLTTPSPSRS